MIDAIIITVKLAGVTTVALTLLCTPLAWWLARGQSGWLRNCVEAAIALPLILPPTVMGFYLLLLLSPEGLFGQFFDRGLAFSFTGLVIGSCVYSLPFVAQPLTASFRQLDPQLIQLGQSQGLNRFAVFRHIILPCCGYAFVAAAALGFAHTVGEFGVILMIGGNIPGETQVLSVLLYDEVESLQYANAHRLAGGLVVVSWVILFMLYRWQRGRGGFHVGA
ncbi:molybdate ABC transporter permease subunit [Gilvimarinus agarilyticus]|uniref:molybdate ABC transporter permease subunit n=1 Tax=Gilvimarinus sp. 2_MG-2023 TaxID=3062666 RepID=UPI001C09F366|nr:molybdate ABC transporter permease subunit [Gilvimarinus sp. 2_MG-2023]MBU2885307.1 molybdate ABC transporter permease subunit [Gilvimarinus agarilyticus]MDO6570206.1 molybdate ABC transporter permease subunit [Gilvimarinus sp. 2_MG-2023]